jgi:6-phosphogluconolactonase
MIRFISLCTLLLLSGPESHGNDTFSVFVPDRPNQQLLSISFRESASGVSIIREQSLPLPFPPAGITRHPNGEFLVINGASKETPAVATVKVSKNSYMNLVATSTLEQPAGYTSVDRSGRYYMTVHYGTAATAVYPIDKAGKIGESIYSQNSPNKEAHCILTTPDNRFAYIPCVKNSNALFQYSFDESTGQLSSLEPFNANPPAMFGPRHVAYHPSLPIAYLSNEQQLGVSVYEIGENGQLTDRQHAITMSRRSPFEQGKRDLHASDLVLSPDGRMLFVAVRDFAGDEDSVFTFRIESDGRLSPIAQTKVGDIPWKLDVSPSGKHLLVKDSGDNKLSIYQIKSNGSLSLASSIEMATGTNDIAIIELR